MRTRRHSGHDGGSDGPQVQRAGKPGARTLTESLEQQSPVAATIQRAQNGDGATINDVATAAVEGKGGGQSVDSSVRSQVEPHLGADLSGVRVHTNRDAAAASTAIGARAFAYHQDVFLGANESPSDVKLMAHELTHVVQQGAAAPHAQRKIEVGSPHDPAEAEADHVADRVASGAPAGGASAGGVLIEDSTRAQPHQLTRSAALSQLRQAAGPDAAPAIEQFVAEHSGKSVAALEHHGRAALGGIKPASATELIAPLAAKLKGEDAAAGGGGGGGGGAAGATAAMKPATTAATIQRLGDGRALDGNMAAAAGEAYGADLSGVRVHTDANAAHMAAEHGARAFAIGNHVAFGAGEYNPGTPVGDAIMAHELAHVVQQQGASPTVQRKPLEVDGNQGAEHEADEAAGGVLARLYTGARSTASNVASRLRAGNNLSLQRCDKAQAPPVTRTVFGITIIGNGASAKAVDECAAFVTQIIGKNKLAQKKMKDDKVTLVIIPANKKMTDLPQFAALKGTNTFDGRLWDNVRGSGGMRAPDGSFAIGVPEENLTVIAGVADGYGPGYSVGMHEFTHALHDEGLSAAQKTKITQLYTARKTAGGPWTEAYGSSNEHEYFAQSTNCYFGKNAGIGNNGKTWMRTNDPAMCDFLDDLYGKKYSESGAVEP